MDLEARLLTRLDELLEAGVLLTKTTRRKGPLYPDEAGLCLGWLTAAKHLVHSICPISHNAY
jgi:hypothetical protein